MKFVYDDGGRAASGYKGNAGDCVARAIAIVAKLPYAEVYDALAKGTEDEYVTKRSGRTSGRRTARSGIHVRRKWFKDYMESLGFKWTPTMGIGTGCKVHLHDGELPMGRLVVSVSKHYTAVVDGEVHDTYDPQRVTVFYEEGKISHIARRCIYGYWRKT